MKCPMQSIEDMCVFCERAALAGMISPDDEGLNSDRWMSGKTDRPCR